MVHNFESKYPRTTMEVVIDGKAKEVLMEAHEFHTDNDKLADAMKAMPNCGKERGQGDFWFAGTTESKPVRGRPKTKYEVVSGVRGAS